MNEKITLPALVQILSLATGDTRKQSEDFIKELFSLISTELANGEQVKIKDFGVFKTTLVEARKSVNVSTGAATEIPSHRKVVFVPSKEIASLVNEPFEMFETVELNEDVEIEDVDGPLAGSESQGGSDTRGVDTEKNGGSGRNDEQTTLFVNESESSDGIYNILDEIEDEDEPEEEDTQALIQTSSVPKVNIADAETGDEELGQDKFRIDEIEETILGNTSQSKPHDIGVLAKGAAECGISDRPEDEENILAEDSQDESKAPGYTTSDTTAEATVEVTTDAASEATSDATLNECAAKDVVDTAPAINNNSDSEIDEASGSDSDDIAVKKCKSRGRCNFFIGFIVGIAVCALVFGLATIFTGNGWNFLKDKFADNKQKQEVVEIEEIDESDTVSLSMDTAKNVVNADESKSAEPKIEEKNDPVPTAPSDKPVYDTISKTRYLTTMAKDHYGNYHLWPYIYIENQSFLGHPDRIKPGTRVVIPDLSKYGVDPNNPSDIKIAKKKGIEIYSRYK